ncbi:MAG TPA: hypothetical protein PLO33_20245 [Kouleothrix sp.]|nr:hypothetical protein [Kouleothrix sp.]
MATPSSERPNYSWRVPLGASLPAEPASQRLIAGVFIAWLVAFALKHGGSSWDVAWHFRYPFGTFEPPHLVNIAGSALAAALVVFHTMTGKAINRAGLYVIQVGFVLFIISAGLDILNHYLFGLDVTVWSPTHMLTFACTTLVLGGVIFSMLRVMRPGRLRLALGLGFWALLLDDALFQLSQQEFGVIAIDAFQRGQSSASRELLALAGSNPIGFAEGGIPHWVYPLWLITTSTLVLALAPRVLGWRWAATTTAALYLAVRVVAELALAWADFPRSFIPAMLIGAAFLIDIAEQRRWPPVAISLALVALYYPSALLIGRYTLMPRFAPETAPVAFVLLWGGYAAARWWSQRRERVAMQAV